MNVDTRRIRHKVLVDFESDFDWPVGKDFILKINNLSSNGVSRRCLIKLKVPRASTCRARRVGRADETVSSVTAAGGVGVAIVGNDSKSEAYN